MMEIGKDNWSSETQTSHFGGRVTTHKYDKNGFYFIKNKVSILIKMFKFGIGIKLRK